MMTRRISSLPLLACLWLLAGCIAPKAVGPQVSPLAAGQERELQYQLLLQHEIEQIIRLREVGWNVLEGGRDFCDKVTLYSGLTILSQTDLDSKFHAAAHVVYGLAEYPKVVAIVTGSNAREAGIETGDTITGFEEADSQQTPQQIVDYLNTSRPRYRLRVLRQGRQLTIDWQAKTMCNYALKLERNDAINAYADGTNIVIYAGMMDFARKDSELALIIAHELAHNLRGHIDAKQTNAIGGLILGTVIDALVGTSGFGRLGHDLGAGVHSVDFEREADYIGLYIMAHSRYDIDDAPLFWRRMAVKSGTKSIDFANTHPSTVDRMLALEAAVREIQQKRAAELPLVPNEVQ